MHEVPQITPVIGVFTIPTAVAKEDFTLETHSFDFEWLGAVPLEGCYGCHLRPPFPVRA